jgi:hypothetical protein
VIIRRERPQPGAQFTDHEGHCFQGTLTDLTGDAVQIERSHHGCGDAENLIRAAKQKGALERLVPRVRAQRRLLELSLIAQDLSRRSRRAPFTCQSTLAAGGPPLNLTCAPAARTAPRSHGRRT